MAINNKRTIGINNTIPWNIPEDLALFRKKTLNNIVIMGRKTFESIKKPLPNRINIVITKNKKENKEDLFFFSSHIKALEFAKTYNKTIFIIGGESIYKLFLPHTDSFMISYINDNTIGDKFFPNIDLKNFRILEKKIFSEFTFVHYSK